MDNPRISVLVPCYNRAHVLRRCVESVLSSTYASVEVIVSDNASTDDSWRLAQQLAAEDSRVRIFKNETNLGPVPNWRRCLEQARGQYIHWLWSDDWVEPRFYETLIGIVDDRGCDVALCAAQVDFCDERRNSFVAYSHQEKEKSGRQACLDTLCMREMPVSPACMLLPADSCRASFIQGISWVGERNIDQRGFGTDSLLAAGSMLRAAKVGFWGLPLVHFEAGADSITTQVSRYASVRRYLGAHLFFIRENRMAFGLKDLRDLLRFCLRGRYYVALPSVVWLYVKNAFITNASGRNDE